MLRMLRSVPRTLRVVPRTLRCGVEGRAKDVEGSAKDVEGRSKDVKGRGKDVEGCAKAGHWAVGGRLFPPVTLCPPSLAHPPCPPTQVVILLSSTLHPPCPLSLPTQPVSDTIRPHAAPPAPLPPSPLRTHPVCDPLHQGVGGNERERSGSQEPAAVRRGGGASRWGLGVHGSQVPAVAGRVGEGGGG